jgi:uncharacterized phage protein (TIGR02220 family)
MDEFDWDTIFQNPLTTADQRNPWCRGMAWIYLLSLAAHDRRNVHQRGHDYTLERGQALVSMSDFAFVAGWSKDQVKRFLDTLARKGDIVKSGDIRGIIVSVKCYTTPVVSMPNVKAPATISATPRPAPVVAIVAQAATPTATPARPIITRELLFSTGTTDREEDEKQEDASHLRMKRQQRTFHEAMAYLNAKVGSRFLVSPDLEARLAKGATLDQVKTVIDKKFEEWNGTEQQVYLRPSTLFCKKHFNEYLNQMIAKLPVNSRHVSASWPSSAYGTPTPEELEDLKRIQALDDATEKAANNDN